jgi:hypothetical protein
MRISKNGPGGYHIGLFGRPTIMREGEDDKGGGGGDDEEEKKFSDRFNKLFHKAMGEREKRLEGKLSKSFETALAAKLDEFMKTIAPPKDDQGGDPKGGAGGGEKKHLSPEIEAMIKQAQKDAKEAKDAADKWRKEAEAEKKRNLRAEERQNLIGALNGMVKPQLLDMVVDQLHNKNLTRDPESGTILWKGDDGEPLPFKDGVAAWMKTDFAKEVAPPRQAGGSGSRGPGDGTNRDPKSFTSEDLGTLLSRMP